MTGRFQKTSARKVSGKRKCIVLSYGEGLAGWTEVRTER